MKRSRTYEDVCRLTWTIGELRKARMHVRLSGAKKAATAVNKAIKSTEGALRHAERIYNRGL